jgi:hypothetical protein
VSHGSDISAQHTVALKEDGSKWAWGNNDHGQLGLGDTMLRQKPAKIPEAPPPPPEGTGSCLVGNWKRPTCGGTKQQSLLLNANGSGEFRNPDCNNICNALVFNFNYTSTSTSVTLHYGVPDPVACEGFEPQRPPQPNDDTFTYTCSGNQLTTTTSSGTVTYTK